MVGLGNEHQSTDVTIEVSGKIDVPQNSKNSEETFLKKLLSPVMQLPAGLQLSSPGAREWFIQRREHLKPWLTFVSSSKFSVPPTPQKWTKRVIQNVDYFLSNYMFVFIGLIIYCLITSPLLLVAVAASLGACYIASLRNTERKLIIAGHELTLAQIYAGIGIISLPIFYMAGATTAIFWVIGASIFIILLHASFYDIEALVGAEDKPFDFQMEEV